MSVYFKKGKGWRYDFTLKGLRYTAAWFKTMTEARQAESDKRKEVKNPELEIPAPTDMEFLELANKRLDHVKAYNSGEYYKTHFYLARRWVKKWDNLMCVEINCSMVQQFLFERKKISSFTANKDLRHLRATFNFGKKKRFITVNPTDGIEFFPLEKRIKYVPPIKDIDKIMSKATPDVQDYLWTVTDTMARVSEINRLTWDDVVF